MLQFGFKKRRGLWRDFGTRYVEAGTVDVVSRPCIPPADTGTMSIDTGTLSLDRLTWSTSITYTAGQKVWAKVDASAVDGETVTATITAVGWTGTYNVVSNDAMVGLIDEFGAFFVDESEQTLEG